MKYITVAKKATLHPTGKIPKFDKNTYKDENIN